MEKRQIKGFENYSVTKEGAVFSGAARLKAQHNKNGSPFVKLRKDGKYHAFVIAKLVALMFIGEPENDNLVVCYKDGNNHNYYVDNLYWGTKSDLAKGLFKNRNTYSEARLQNLKKAVSRPVASYKAIYGDLAKIKEYESITDAAADVGVTPGSISRCLKDTKAMSSGYYWRYLEKEGYNE